MEETALANALKQTGFSVHCSNNVWWQEVSPQFCKPINPLRMLRPGDSAPKFRFSALGYSHAVPNAGQGTRDWSVLSMDGEPLKAFDIARLKPRKRTGIRKALTQLDIRRIDAIDPVLGSMKEICISAVQRTGHGKPPDYYVKSRQEWEAHMRREFSIPGREWWGAFAQGKLVAYYYAYLIESVMYISAAKSHSEALPLLPNDALLFRFLEYCRDLASCNQVVFGDWSPDAPTLNQFKGYYGFEKKCIPVYRHIRAPFRFVVGARHLANRWLKHTPDHSANLHSNEPTSS